MIRPPAAAASPRYRRVLWAALVINAAMFGVELAGGLQHLAGEMFNYLGGVNIVHIPYKGGGQAMGDIIVVAS